SFLTPPFGFALFYLRGVAPVIVKTVQIYKGVIVFIMLQLSGLAIVGFYPALVNYLPERLKLTSDSAPPPVNPGLQYCLEGYVHEALEEEGGALRAAIAEARGLDLSALPRKLRRETEESFEAAGAAVAGIAEITAAEQAVAAEADGYRPIQQTVRAIEAKIRRIEARLEDEETILGRTNTSDAARARAEARAAALTAERDALAAQIPAEWEPARDAFAALTKAENDARRTYRRNADKAYQPVEALLGVLEGTPALTAFRPEIVALQEAVAAAEPKEGIDLIREVERAVGRIDGASDVSKPLTAARRALRGRNPEPEKAAEKLAEALEALDEAVTWREEADRALRPGLTAYLEALSGTIGLRSQPKLPREVALSVAACRAVHRDLSLNF
ncbi:MAG: C4-dicarboxylate ABC transporter permease, partial [Pseudomonadota bacterium]